MKRKEDNSALKIVRTFSRRIREWRLEKDWPQKRIAQELGVSLSILSDWERGYRFPCAKHLDRIAEYSGRSIGWFFTDAPDKASTRKRAKRS